MLSTLIRQQVQLASSARLSSPLTRQFLCGLPKYAQKPAVLSQRTFSISHSLCEDYSRGSSRRDFSRDRPERRRRLPNLEKRNTLYVGNLPFTAREDDLRGLFESYGQIKRITLAADDTGRITGFGFVEFENLDDAVTAVQSSNEEPFVLSSRNLNISYAHDRASDRGSDRAMDQGEPEPNTTLHISNFPFPGEEGSVRQLLQDYESHILRVNFMKRRDGDYTNKVFIQFSDQETATAALNALQDHNLEGTTIKMTYARNRFPPRTSKMADFDA